MEVTIYKDGNAIRIKPASPAVVQALNNCLVYTRVKHLVGWQERQAAGRNMEFIPISCFKVFQMSGVQQAVAAAGFLSRVVRELRTQGIRATVKEIRGHPRPHVFQPVWQQLGDLEFRHKQRETLEKLLQQEYGQVCWATGAGKTWLIPLCCTILPKAKILVTTKHLAVLRTIYQRLCQVLPDVGMLSSKSVKTGRRVMCVSAGSLHKAVDFRPDLLIADEVHELATDHMFEQLARFPACRMWGFSANYRDRQDKVDFELEGFFGPLVATLSYQEAEKHEMVVPIEVHWRNVLTADCAAGLEGVELNRRGIWLNTPRNRLIAQDARSHDDKQVLIVTKTLEHACQLKALLPDFTLCYSPGETNRETIAYYQAQGALPHDFKTMNIDRLKKLQAAFEKGKLRKVIATSVWNRGVDFVGLQVLIRADGGASEVDDTQIPGRLSRVGQKDIGLMIDYYDQFNKTLSDRAMRRRRAYLRKGWIQVEPAENTKVTGVRAIKLRRQGG